jgi:hypothetical protein
MTVELAPSRLCLKGTQQILDHCESADDAQNCQNVIPLIANLVQNRNTD